METIAVRPRFAPLLDGKDVGPTETMSAEEAREQLIRNVVELRGSLPELAARLRKFPWDCDHELVVVQSVHLAAIMRRYVEGDLSAADVESWADLIECRDDVGFTSEELKEAVHRLANQAVHGALTPEMAHAIVRDYDDTV